MRDERHCFGMFRQVVLMVTLMLQRSCIQLKRYKMVLKYTAVYVTFQNFSKQSLQMLPKEHNTP